MFASGRGRAIIGLTIAIITALLLSACGVTRGEESGLHRLRMMVPNSPGGGYDLTARSGVKIMEDDDITGRIEVFNVIGAGGTVAMARLINERGNGDLMMMMGLGVVGATYTNGSKARASDATPAPMTDSSKSTSVNLIQTRYVPTMMSFLPAREYVQCPPRDQKPKAVNRARVDPGR